MNTQEKVDLSKKILQVIQSIQGESDSWVDLARIGGSLANNGVQYKKYSPKLSWFLNEFQDMLEFKTEEPIAGKPLVYYARLKSLNDNSAVEDRPLSSPVDKSFINFEEKPIQGEKIPAKGSWLFDWANIRKDKIKQLSELALEERWYYGEILTQEQENLPILRSYLVNTFKRLCFEEKISIGIDGDRNEEYAAFNTGLVDKKYEYIYALFKQNTFYTIHKKHCLLMPYWYLVDFVVAGEDIGKMLGKVFNPLPKRADYFENKIQNMLYDPSTGSLTWDYTHIITERVYRLPVEFLEENCPEFLSIDGINIKDVCDMPDRDKASTSYYKSLGGKIRDNPKIFNRLKNRIQDAINLALKRVEWNYKTAIPTYYPKEDTGSLLLPLSLVDENRVDLALVVTRHDNGSYQGQTILPLQFAYSNSRLVTRPDSDWLKTDVICAIRSNDGIVLVDDE